MSSEQEFLKYIGFDLPVNSPSSEVSVSRTPQLRRQTQTLQGRPLGHDADSHTLVKRPLLSWAGGERGPNLPPLWVPLVK